MTEQGSSLASPVGNAKGPALTWSERAGPNSGAIRNAAPLGCLNARYERMVDGVGASKARRFGLELQRDLDLLCFGHGVPLDRGSVAPGGTIRLPDRGSPPCRAAKGPPNAICAVALRRRGRGGNDRREFMRWPTRLRQFAPKACSKRAWGHRGSVAPGNNPLAGSWGRHLAAPQRARLMRFARLPLRRRGRGGNDGREFMRWPTRLRQFAPKACSKSSIVSALSGNVTSVMRAHVEDWPHTLARMRGMGDASLRVALGMGGHAEGCGR